MPGVIFKIENGDEVTMKTDRGGDGVADYAVDLGRLSRVSEEDDLNVPSHVNCP